MSRDVAWYAQLQDWLLDGFGRAKVDRLGLRHTPLKLLACHDSPGAGHTTWCTFEYSDRRWRGPNDLSVGYELVFAARGVADGLTVLRRATEVLDAVGRPPQPGLVLTGLFQGVQGVSTTLPHGLCVPPWAWEGLTPLDADGGRVEVFVVVPISDAEVERVRAEGFEALAAAWERDLVDPLVTGRTG